MFLLRKSSAAVALLHRSDGVTVPGCVQETCGYGTEGYGLVGHIGGRWTVGLDHLRSLC